MTDWAGQLEREVERYRDGERRLPGRPDPAARERQLTRLGNAANGAGLALSMLGRRDEAAVWLVRAAERYRESLAGAPAASWGRSIGALKARLLAGDGTGAAADARRALELGAAGAESPIGRYAATLALLALGRDPEAAVLAGSLQGRDDFPEDVAAALSALAAGEGAGYARAVAGALTSFAQRDAYLDGLPVADTVAVLQVLARQRGIRAELASPLLPSPL